MKALLVFLLVGSLVFAIVGFWRGWFGMNVSDAKTDEVHVDFKMDKARLKDDARKVAETAKDLVDTDEEAGRTATDKAADVSETATETETLEGRVTSVGKDTLVLLTEHDIVEVVHLKAGTDVQLTGARTGLREGDEVRVFWHSEEGRKVAGRVTLK